MRRSVGRNGSPTTAAPAAGEPRDARVVLPNQRFVSWTDSFAFPRIRRSVGQRERLAPVCGKVGVTATVARSTNLAISLSPKQSGRIERRVGNEAVAIG